MIAYTFFRKRMPKTISDEPCQQNRARYSQKSRDTRGFFFSTEIVELLTPLGFNDVTFGVEISSSHTKSRTDPWNGPGKARCHLH